MEHKSTNNNNNRMNLQQQNKQALDYVKNGASNNYSLPKNLMLSRGFSKVQANQEFVNETRAQIETNLGSANSVDITKFKEDNQSSLSKRLLNNELTCYSFMLPNLNKFTDYKLKEYLQNELIELPAQYNLTESGHLNWWTLNDWENVCRPLYPMMTSGDGNCLLHAASLAMWGLHDRYLILRKALHSALKEIKEDNTSALWRRWKWEQMCQNRKCGLIYDDDEWAKEWQSLLKLSSYQPRVHLNNNNNNNNTTSTRHSSQPNEIPTSSSSSSISSNVNKQNGAQPQMQTTQQQQQQTSQDGTCYFESLEEFHVFLLAHILNRPIIIVSDTMLHDLNGEPLSPIPFGGIYLPFECDLAKCHRYPLVLAYDSAHFSALVLMDDDDFDDTENGRNNNNNNDFLDYDDDEDDELNEDDISNQIDTDENHDLATFYPKRSKENSLTLEQINIINKKIQIKPPYACIPLTYSNKELLPIHFAFDPGPDYDWSKFPQLETESAKRNCLDSANNYEPHSNDEISILSLNKQQQQYQRTNGANFTNDRTQDQVVELTRSQKMFLIQKYLDIVKLELFDPGPLYKRNAVNQAFNSSGMCANICNIHVSEPVESLEKFTNGENGYYSKTKSKSQNKLQKFLNLFKRNTNASSSEDLNLKSSKTKHDDSHSNSSLFNSGRFRKSIKNLSDFASHSQRKTPELTSSSSSSAVISTNPNNNSSNINNIQTISRIDLPMISNSNSSKTLPVKLKSPSAQGMMPLLGSSTSSNSVSKILQQQPKYLYFHKLVTYKNWNYLFDSMTHHSCLLGVKLNLAKQPKFKKIIHNYIESTKQKLELIKQQQKVQILQQQQLQQQQMHLQQQQQQQQRQTLASTNRVQYNGNDRRPVHICPANRIDCSKENPCSYCYTNIAENFYSKNNTNLSRLNNHVNYNQFSYNTAAATANINGRRDYYYKTNDKINEDEIATFHHI